MTNEIERKKELRKKVREIVKMLDEPYMESASAAIEGNILGLPEYKAARVIFCYVSTKTEPRTLDLMDQFLNDGKTVCVPLCLEEGYMAACAISDPYSDLAPGAFGIFEPVDRDDEIAPETFDLAIVPCLAADRAGGRMGHGKGYYDRYLKKMRCPKIVICFEKLMREPGEIPMDGFDVVMDAAVTEAGVFRSGR